jgi:mevalonate kinase
MNYHSNGKLMLTGEYLVLKGAQSLALPLCFGQGLMVEPSESGLLHWRTFVEGNQWFYADFDLEGFHPVETNIPEVAKILQQLLMNTCQLNPSFLTANRGCKVTSTINFKMEWGIGSSSSLVSNIANWAECDPYELNRRVFHGSGYDIACARSNKPLIYQLKEGVPIVSEFDFYPSYSENLFFVWINRKQNTRDGLLYFDRTKAYRSEIDIINAITREMIDCKSLFDVQQLMRQHETVMASVLNTLPVQQRLFPDFQGSIKSLGAWGGDFVLVATDLPVNDVRNYFKQKGFQTVFEYDKVVKPF